MTLESWFVAAAVAGIVVAVYFADLFHLVRSPP